MAIYVEDAAGKITCVNPDLSANDVIRIKEESILAAGLEISPCRKDTLATKIPVGEV